MHKIKWLLISCIANFFISSAIAQSAYQLSTHVLNVTSGMPGEGIVAELSQQVNQGGAMVWETIAKGITDRDGRVANFYREKKGKRIPVSIS